MKTITTLAALALTLLTCGCSEINSILAVANVGREGPAGQDGADGQDGMRGLRGVDGEPGPMGPQGIQGPKGEPGKDGESTNKSGSRLQMMVLLGEDGSQQFAGFHDKELDVDCEFSVETGNDYHPRCYPTRPVKWFDDVPDPTVDKGEGGYEYVRSRSMRTVWRLVCPLDAEDCEDATLVKAEPQMFTKATKMPAPDQP